MRTNLLKFSLVLLCLAAWQVGTGIIGNAMAVGSATTLSEDAATGRITVETPDVKGVWQYKTLAAQNFNQGGGDIYELYYKPMDPGATRNLVSFTTMRGWGNGQSTSLWIGIGGVGATTMYAADSSPGSAQSNNFSDVLGDNNLSGVLESHSAVIDQNGNAVLTFSYKVHNQATGKEWYRVEKKWTVEPGGAIHLGISWTILNTGYFTEPALRTAWSYDVGWDQFVKYGRDWLQPNQPKYLSGSSGISRVTCNCYDYLNQFVPDWYSLTGSSVAPTVTMAPDNNGQGFSALGSYLLGVNVWGSPANPVQEECTIKSNYSAAHLINWMAAWGGSPPAGNRYARMEAGRTWSDTYRIDFSQNPPGGGPVVSNVTLQQVDSTSVKVSWSTNVASDSAVEVSTDNGSSWRAVGQDQHQTTSHSVVTTSLTPGGSYTYRVKSRDASANLSVSSGFTLDNSRPPLSLALNNSGVSWESYNDYLNGLLSVNFKVDNLGTADAGSVNITTASATGGVMAMTPLPIALGNIAGGSSSQFKIVYKIAAGVNQFNTSLRCTTIGPDGVLVNFPSPTFSLR